MGACCSCRSTSAPRVEQKEARLDPRQRRSLAGCRLSRTPVTIDPSFLWPWPPSLPDSRRFGPPFGGLPVLRGHPTSPVPSSPRSFVLDDYRREPPAGGQEISPGKKRRTSCEPVAFTRDRRERRSGLGASCRLDPAVACLIGASLVLSSTLHRRASIGPVLADTPLPLVTGSLRSGPRKDFDQLVSNITSPSVLRPCWTHRTLAGARAAARRQRLSAAYRPLRVLEPHCARWPG